MALLDRHFKRLLIGIAYASIWGLPYVLIVTAHRQAVSPNGTEKGLLEVVILLGIPMLFACVAVPVSLLLLFPSRHRKAATIVLVFSVSFIFATRFGSSSGYKIRRTAFEDLATRSTPIVAAIKEFTATNGAPPAGLTNLVPEFLPSIPSTGIGAYPDYLYEVPESNDTWDGNPWVLWIPTSSGGINFDKFLYFPIQNYPESGYGGWLERVGDWAYVHE